VLGFAAALADCAIPGVIERVPTFRSVTVHFDPDLIDPPRLAADLLALAQPATRPPPAAGAGCCRCASTTRWRPICPTSPPTAALPARR
jgi:hypothetical protein